MSSPLQRLLLPLASGLLVLVCFQLTAASAQDLNLPEPLTVLTNCSQSSVAPESSCQSAISNTFPDGGFTNATACSQTQNGSSEWWQAQLPPNSTGRVSYVLVTALNSDYTKPNVTLDGSECPWTRYGLGLSGYLFLCNRTGQTIQVTSTFLQTQLTVCRVQAFVDYLGDFDADHPLLPLSNCSQSPLIPSDTCQNLIDGLNQDGFCPALISNEWWEARTQVPTLIKYIRIYQVRNARFVLYQFNFSVTVDGSECVSYSGPYFSARDFLCNRTGQVIRFVLNPPVGPVVSLCKVKAFGERQAAVDYGAPLRLTGCKQSSSVRGGRCRKALDGRTAQLCGQCARTRVGRSWWRGRTGRRVLVKFVRVFLPAAGGGCGPQDLNQTAVTVGRRKCSPFESAASVHTLLCNATGREVTIRSLGASELTVCEVQAMGEYLKPGRKGCKDKKKSRKNPKRHKPKHKKPRKTRQPKPRRPQHRAALTRCSQSSSVAGSRCHHAIVGSRRRCAKTAAERAAWWQAGIRSPKGIKSHRVATVILALQHSLPREGVSAAALSRLRVSVSGQPCRLHSARRGSGAAFKCDRVGSLVRVSNRPGSLSPLVLCEVLVLAWPLR